MFRVAGLLGLMAAAAVTNAVAPIPGFRPPSVPLISQSPLINSWSNYDNLNDGPVTDWTGWNQDLVAMARVDGAAYVLMGVLWDATEAYANATQTCVVVYPTQSVYSFTAGAVAIDLTFTS